MKKSFLMLAAGAMLTAASASAATVYFEKPAAWAEVWAHAWTPTTDEQVTETTTIDGHDLYVYNTECANVIFIQGEGNWNGQTSDLAVEDGAVYGEANCNKGGDAPVAHIVDGKYVADVVTPDVYPAMYLVGNINGWSASSKFKMSTEDGITYTLTVPDMDTKDFKFFGGNWGTRELTGAGQALADGTYTLGAGSANMTLATGGNVTFTLVQSDDFASAQLTIAGQGGDTPIPPVPGEATYELWGEFNGGWSAVALPKNDTGLYVGTFAPAAASGSFGVRKMENGTQVAWYNAAAGTVLSQDNKSITLVTDGENITFDLVANRTYTATLDLETMNLSIAWDESEIPVVTYPEHLYIIGEANGIGWTPDAVQEMINKEEGVYVKYDVDCAGNFSFCTAVGANADDWSGIGTRYTAAANGTELSSEVPAAIGVNNPDNAFIANGVYDIKVDLKEGNITIYPAGTLGVSAVNAAEEGEAVYFNLQGVRVANPENGIFVKVAAGKAVKVVK